MGFRVASVAAAAAVALGASASGLAPTAAPAKTLDIYFIDVEGGQSTLVVTPAGESLLVDAGFPGKAGTFDARPGDPREARDANRIAAVVRQAGLTRIDYLLVTHFHGDHDGGVAELAELVPIGTFIDHGNVPDEAETTSKGTLELYRAYAGARAAHPHLQPKPGDRLPLKDVTAIVVSAAQATALWPLRGAGSRNPRCGDGPRPPEEPFENPRSTGFRLEYGRFRFLDVGDLTGAPLYALACPRDLAGPVSVYLVAHHGGADASDPATLAGFEPRVAIVNNGATKGGAPEIFAALRGVPALEDAWQLHTSVRDGARNFAEDRIANLDETTAHDLVLRAYKDGSFAITNSRTGMTVNYGTRR